MTKKRYLFRWVSFSVGLFQSISSSFYVWISQNFVNRSMIVLFSSVLFCNCGTCLSALRRVELFGDRTIDVRKFVRIQTIQVLWSARSTFVCPGTLMFSCCRTITEEIEISFAQHGITLRWNDFWMCRMSAMVITSLFPFAFCNGSTSCKHISTDFPFVVVPD